jgi:hypothetical protein
MHDAKVGIWRDRYSGGQTADRAIGTVKSDENTCVGTARGLVDQEHRALTEAHHPLGRGANDSVCIGAFARCTDKNQVGLYPDAFADDGAERVPGADDHGGRRLHTHRVLLRDFACKKRFRTVLLLSGQNGRQADGNDMKEGEPLRASVPAKLRGPLQRAFGPIGEIGRDENVRDLSISSSFRSSRK